VNPVEMATLPDGRDIIVQISVNKTKKEKKENLQIKTKKKIFLYVAKDLFFTFGKIYLFIHVSKYILRAR